MTGFKAKMSQVTDVAELENQTNGRSSNNHGTQVRFWSFCRVFFTFNKYVEFLASQVICVYETVGLWRMDFGQSLR